MKYRHLDRSEVKWRNLLCFATALLLIAAPLRAQDSLHAIADRVDNHYNHLASLKLDYIERYSGMGQSRTEHGTLLLKKPGKMRFNYATPAGKVFLLDGKYAYFYTPGDLQATRIPAKQLDDLRSPLRFLLGHTKIEKELTHLNMTSSNESAIITGVPKGMEERVKQFTLTCNPATGVLTGLKIEETGGAITEFSFSNLQENLSLPDVTFQFLAPQGVTVVEGMNPM